MIIRFTNIDQIYNIYVCKTNRLHESHKSYRQADNSKLVRLSNSEHLYPMIRVLAKSDYQSYSSLRSLGLKTEPTSFWASESQELPIRKARFLESLAIKDNFILGYFYDGSLVSIAGFVRESHLKLKHKGFIWGVFTHPDYRGRGFGKQLMLALIDQAFKSQGLQQINLSTRTDNKAAINLYERLGFEKYGVEKHAAFVDGFFFDEVYMAKHKA